MESISFTHICRTVAVACLLAAASPSLRAADDDAEPPQKPPAAEKHDNLSNWWHKSSFEADAPGRTLYHADGTLSFQQAQGNSSGHSVDTRGNFDARRGRTTSNLFVHMTKRDMDYGPGGGSTVYGEYTVREQVDYDLTRRVKLVGGGEYYRNTLMFMDLRGSGYGGVGANLYRSERHQVNMTFAMGYSTFAFDRNQMVSVNPAGTAALRTITPSSAGALAMQSWRWVVSPRLTFTERSSRMEYFSRDLGFRWTLDLDGDVPVSKHFSVNVSYHMKHETNVYIQTLRVKPYDRSFNFGVRFSI